MSSIPSSTGSALTRQCSHSSDLPSLSPSSGLTSHRSFSFIRSPSFGSKPHATATATIPESDKEPIFDEIRDCDEAPYPQTNTKSLSPTRGGSKTESTNTLSLKKSAGKSNRSTSNGTTTTTSQPHKHRWMNKLDPRFDTKLLEEQRRRVEKEEKDRRKKKEEGMIEDLMPKWVQ